MKIARGVSVEIGLDIKLIFAKAFITAYYTEKQRSAGRGSAKFLTVKLIARCRDKVSWVSRLIKRK